MVKMKNDRISLPTIDARMRRQVFPDPALVFVFGCCTSLFNVRSMFIPVRFVPNLLVLNKAALAPRVTDAELGISKSELV